MTVTENDFIISQNLDSKLQKIETKDTNLYKTVDSIRNNNLNFNINNNEKPLHFLNNNINNIRGKTDNNANLKKEKPQFITTVRSGVFLEPPHEIAILLGLSKKSKFSPSSSNSLGSAETVGVSEKPLVMYSYSSRPKILNNKNYHANCGRSKREADGFSDAVRGDRREPLPYGNIMYDRRVIRGSTFASFPVPTEGFNQSVAEKRREARRRTVARKKAKGFCIAGRMGTPPPLMGRRHEPVQTERYLEELFDRPLEAEAACQTDLFLDRPATPFYVPVKTGYDQSTQIWPGELFDFDVEVLPLIEVLVGKTIEQSLMEVMEEEEISDLRAQQRQFQELRNAEKAEEQRLEEEEKRLAEEKAKRISEQEAMLHVQKETEERVAAAMLTETYIADLVPNVLEGLKEAGFLQDEIQADVGNNFMPWLMGEVKTELSKMISSRDILEEIIREILREKAENYTRMGDYFAGEQKNEEVEGEKEEETEENEEKPVPQN